jgi:hypothetical protein
MNSVDVTMKLCRDGACWYEHHWMETTTIEDPVSPQRVVAIEDGTDDIRPLIVWIVPDMTLSLDGVLL